MSTPVGPYSPVVRFGDLLVTSGQIGLRDGVIVPGGFAAEIEQVLANLDAVLVSAGASRTDVVKTTVFLTDAAHWAEMNEHYLAYFGDHRPARSAVTVAALPMGALVEIEAWAHHPARA